MRRPFAASAMACGNWLPREIHPLQESLMSTPAIPAAASTALSSTIFQLHALGHKRGLQSDALTDPSSSGASQTPSGSTQNLFGTVMSSLEQAIGIQHPQLGQTSATAPSQSTSGAQQSTGSKLNVTA
jgi:hypothetical protein